MHDGGVDDSRPNDGGADAPDASIAGADLSIAITASPEPVAANGTLTYTVDVTNHGGLDASKLNVVFRLPAGNTAFIGATGIGWQCAAAGQIVTCTRLTLLVGPGPSIAITVTTPGSGGVITSTATVSAETFDYNTTNNDATSMTTVLTPADLRITMVDSPDPIAAGGMLTYTITVANAGPGTASELVVLDTLPMNEAFVSAQGTGWSCSANGQDVTCLNPSLANAASSTISLIVTVPTAGGTQSNTATVTATSPDPVTGNNAATATTTVNAAADLGITVSDSPDPVQAGGQLTYQIDVDNAGPNAASGITVTNQLPSGNVAFVSVSGIGWACNAAGQVVTCTRPTLSAGTAPSITIVVTAPSEATTLVDVATVTSTSSDLNNGNNSASTSTMVTAAANLSVAMTDSPDPVSTSGTLTYSITATNAGPSNAVGVTVTDVLPSGTTFQSASGTNWSCALSGQTVTCTVATLVAGVAPVITLVVTAPSVDSTIMNTAQITSTIFDPNTANNSATQSTTVNAPSDLALALTASPEPVSASSTLTYQIDVTNLGPRDATNLVVTNRLPDGNVTFQSASGIGWACSQLGQIVTCTRPLLIAGSAPSLTIKITTPSSMGPLVDTASVSATTADPDQSNNTATVTSNAIDSADLSIVMTDAPDPVRIGTTVTYVLTIANAGPTAATSVRVRDTLPSNTTFISASGAGWACGNVGQLVTCTVPNLNTSSSAPSITITANVPATAQTITNSAQVDSTTFDPQAANNTATTSTLVNAFADLSITLADSPDPVAKGGQVTYTIDVTNNGPDAATGITVVNTLPIAGSFLSVVGVGWVCPAPSSGKITCTRSASLTSGAFAPSITIVWKAPDPGGFSIVDSVDVSSSSTDTNSANNAATNDTTVSP